MLAQLTYRLLKEPDPRLLAKLAWNCGWKGMCAINAFNQRLKQGQFFPAFVFLSITNACNLRCQGCWVAINHPARSIDSAVLERTLIECKKMGASFFGILGGEPLLYPGLFDVIARHPDCYFQVFTNGTLVTDELARRMRRLGNVTPLISIEGKEQVSDERRGGQSVYRRALEALEHCRRHRLLIGVATSVCRTNFVDLVNRDFVDDLIARGVHYLWYYIYRPVGEKPSPELALTKPEIIKLRQFIVETRSQAPIIIVDAYWDHEGRALCPAATGISHHIGPGGDIEPCPVVQFAKDNIQDGNGLFEKFNRSEFLAQFRTFAARTTRGCVLMDHPEALRQFLLEQHAVDTTGRGTGLAELSAMQPRPSHHLPGHEIPEKSWVYRFAKKHWFFGFGAYG